MTVPVRRAHAVPAESDDDLEDAFAPREFYSGERICPEPERMGGSVLRGLLVIAIALGGGWALISYQAAWRGWLAAELATISSAIDQHAPAPVAATGKAAVAPPLPPPAPVAEPVMPPQAAGVTQSRGVLPCQSRRKVGSHAAPIEAAGHNLDSGRAMVDVSICRKSRPR